MRLFELERKSIGQKVTYDSLPASVKSDIEENLWKKHDYFKWTKAPHPNEVRRLLQGNIPPVFVRIFNSNVQSLLDHAIHNHSEHVVDEYAKKLIQNPSFDFDPILVADGRFYDGGHRLKAYAKAGRKTIPVVEIGHLVYADFHEWEDFYEGDLEALRLQESASSGATGASAIATAVSPLGTTLRRTMPTTIMQHHGYGTEDKKTTQDYMISVNSKITRKKRSK